MTTPPNAPVDRTGMLIGPVASLLVSAILSGLVVYKAYQLETTGTIEHVYSSRARNQLVGELAEGLARTLGLWPSIAVGALVTIAMGAWLGVTYRKYRALVAEDARSGQLQP